MKSVQWKKSVVDKGRRPEQMKWDAVDERYWFREGVIGGWPRERRQLVLLSVLSVEYTRADTRLTLEPVAMHARARSQPVSKYTLYHQHNSCRTYHLLSINRQHTLVFTLGFLLFTVLTKSIISFLPVDYVLKLWRRPRLCLEIMTEDNKFWNFYFQAHNAYLIKDKYVN